MPRLDRDNPNTFIGVILLIVLAVFVLPERIPQFIGDLSPTLFSGMPCARLPAARDLSAHQSVLGRRTQDPLLLELAAGTIAQDGSLALRLTVTNRSLGTVPLLYQADNIVIAAVEDKGQGLGLFVEPEPVDPTITRANPDADGFPESDIRLLGPQQKCSHAFEVDASQQMIADGGKARAWYRMGIGGAHQPGSEDLRLLFPDQGLAILSEAVVYSKDVEIAART